VKEKKEKDFAAVKRQRCGTPRLLCQLYFMCPRSRLRMGSLNATTRPAMIRTTTMQHSVPIDCQFATNDLARAPQSVCDWYVICSPYLRHPRWFPLAFLIHSLFSYSHLVYFLYTRSLCPVGLTKAKKALRPRLCAYASTHGGFSFKRRCVHLD